MYWNFKLTVKNFSGQFNLRFAKKVGTSVFDKSTYNVTADATCATLNATIVNQVYGVPTLCERTDVLAADGVTVIGKTWNLKFLYRPADEVRVLPKVVGATPGLTTANYLVELVSEPSAPVSGTF